jgi:hypothetical protein
LLFKEPPPALFVDGSRTNTATAATYRLTDLRQWGKRLAVLCACCGAHLIAADQRRQQRAPWHKRPRTTTTGANNPIVSYPGTSAIVRVPTDISASVTSSPLRRPMWSM